jgi:membrane protein
MLFLTRRLPRSVNAFGLGLLRRIEQAELSLISAGVAFFGFLALFPAVAVIIALWGAFSDPVVIESEVLLLKPFLPPDAHGLILVQVRALMEMSGAPLGWATLASTLFALWSARAGVAALIRGLNAIHGLPNRGSGQHHLRAILLTLVLIGLALASMIATVVGPIVIGLLPLPGDDATLLHRLNLAFGVVLVVLAMALAYRFGPNHRIKPRWVTPGLVVGVVLWAFAARGFMIYLANFPSYNKVYGTIGAVVILLVWLYVSAFSVLLGAAVDAETRRRQ